MSRALRAVLIAGVILVVVVFPFVAYRDEYTYRKRLRVVVPGRVYRSGQMTAAGFRDAVRELKIRTVINLQEDVPDPDLDLHYWTTRTVKESELCRQLGVNFVAIGPDLVVRRLVPRERPRAIDEFLAVMGDERNYPVLFHCKAGLHRTGCLAAVYRMEYQGWSRDAALRELRAHGFGEWVSTAPNDYITQYVLTFTPGLRRTPDGRYVAGGQGSGVRGQESEVGIKDQVGHD
jgi:tyrosine-protein phosphatase SIW14